VAHKIWNARDAAELNAELSHVEGEYWHLMLFTDADVMSEDYPIIELGRGDLEQLHKALGKELGK
jgi:hypothetical protein